MYIKNRRNNNKKTMDKQIIKDIFEWDVLNWSKAIDFNYP